MKVHVSSKFILILILLFAAAVVVYLFLEAGERLGLRRTQIPEGGPPYFTEGIALAADEAVAIEEGITCSRNNAIVQAARNGVQIEGSDIYVTASPCYNCFKLIANSGIKRIFYGELYRDERIKIHAKEAGIELIHLA